jgi:adenylate cyclase
MTEERTKRRLSAILSADVKGYSRLMQDDESSTVQTIKTYREVMTMFIQQYRGRVVDSPGDNILAEFASVVDAVECAEEIQEALKIRNDKLPEDRKMEFRIGINLGDVIVDGDRIYGEGLNIAARLEGLAEGGGICISGTVYEHIKNKLPIDCDYLGEQHVKNIIEPVRVYQIKMNVKTAFPERNKEVKLPDKPSIAVLPFINMSADKEQEYFCDGIAEDILNDLTRLLLPELQVSHSRVKIKTSVKSA